MKRAICKLESLSPYCQSRYVDAPKNKGENAEDFEARTWRMRAHVVPDGPNKGQIYIPALSLANSLKEGAKFASIPIPGNKQARYTKHFDAGVLVLESLVLPVKLDDIEGETLFVPSDGKRGGGKRVKRTYPVVPKWSGEVVYHIIDPVITKEAFTEAMETAGQLIGIGSFRVANRGIWGRYKMTSLIWE